MSSLTTPPPVFARFTIRRFAALLLASNGPGTKLPCFLESAANAKRESESLKMSSVIQRWYSVGAGALTRRGTARQQRCRLNDIRDLNCIHHALASQTLLDQLALVTTSRPRVLTFTEMKFNSCRAGTKKAAIRITCLVPSARPIIF